MSVPSSEYMRAFYASEYERHRRPEDYEFLCRRCPEIRQNPGLIRANDIQMLSRLIPSINFSPERIPSLSGERTAEEPEVPPAIVEVFTRSFLNNDEFIIKYLKLDEWHTEGDKPEAVRKIVDAYKQWRTELILRGLGLTSLPEQIVKLKNLETLYIDDNLLTELPDNIESLKNLEKLDVSYNQLTRLPESIGMLPRLKSLKIKDNQLTELPDSIVNLHTLHELNVAKNRLTKLPNRFGEVVNVTKYGQTNSVVLLGNLRDLNLACNRLTALPESIGRFIHLQELNVYENLLVELPEGTGSLHSLKQLIVEGNQLTRLPETIEQLRNLHTLIVNRNPLTELPAVANREFRESQVRYLGLDGWATDGNKQEAVDRIVEAYLSDEEELDLRGLGLTEFPKGLTKLHHLKSFKHDIVAEPIQVEELVIIGSIPPWIDVVKKEEVNRVFILNYMLDEQITVKMNEFPQLKRVILISKDKCLYTT